MCQRGLFQSREVRRWGNPPQTPLPGAATGAEQRHTGFAWSLRPQVTRGTKCTRWALSGRFSPRRVLRLWGQDLQPCGWWGTELASGRGCRSGSGLSSRSGRRRPAAWGPGPGSLSSLPAAPVAVRGPVLTLVLHVFATWPQGCPRGCPQGQAGVGVRAGGSPASTFLPFGRPLLSEVLGGWDRMSSGCLSFLLELETKTARLRASEGSAAGQAPWEAVAVVTTPAHSGSHGPGSRSRA